MILAFVVLPLALFAGVLLAPRGLWARAAIGVGAIVVFVIAYDVLTWTNTSGDPHAGIGRGLGQLALALNALAYGSALAIRFATRSGGSTLRWFGLAAGALLAIVALYFLIAIFD